VLAVDGGSGQRAASQNPASGLVAVGVPASFRQSALAGSVNQHSSGTGDNPRRAPAGLFTSAGRY
jgi:hypothetical protein